MTANYNQYWVNIDVDVEETLVCAGENVLNIRVSSTVLTLASEVFARMLSGHFR